jgi:hypothetical protein
MCWVNFHSCRGGGLGSCLSSFSFAITEYHRLGNLYGKEISFFSVEKGKSKGETLRAVSLEEWSERERVRVADLAL